MSEIVKTAGETCTNQKCGVASDADHVLFELKEEHIKLLERLNLTTILDYPEESMWYVPAIDGMSPFRNGDVVCSAFTTLNIEPQGEKDTFTTEQEDEVYKLIIELPIAFDIVMKHHAFIPGVYEIEKDDVYLKCKRRLNHLELRKPLEKYKKSFQSLEDNRRRMYMEKLELLCKNSYTEDPYVCVLNVIEEDYERTYVDDSMYLSVYSSAKSIFERCHEAYLGKNKCEPVSE